MIVTKSVLKLSTRCVHYPWPERVSLTVQSDPSENHACITITAVLRILTSTHADLQLSLETKAHPTQRLALLLIHSVSHLDHFLLTELPLPLLHHWGLL